MGVIPITQRGRKTSKSATRGRMISKAAVPAQSTTDTSKTKPSKHPGGRPLTNKQVRFIQEYPIDFNATRAAIRAGYSPKRADAIGYDVLRNTEVQAAIKESLKKTASKAEDEIQWVLDGLKNIAVLGVKEQDYSAANRALELRGKHYGMFIDRVQEIDPAIATQVIIQVEDATNGNRKSE